MAAHTENSPVELKYQEGLYYSNRYNHRHEEADFERSFAAFQETLSLDPGFSDAAAEIAWLYEYRMESGLDPGEGRSQIDRWARRAIAIDRENGRAWSALAILESGQGRIGGSALSSALLAVRHAPEFPRSHMALALAVPSDRLGLAAARESERLDPLFLYAPMMVGDRLAHLGTDVAIIQRNVDRVLAIEPDFPVLILFLANGLGVLERFEEAASLLSRVEPMVASGRIAPGNFEIVRDTHLVLRGDPSSDAARQRLGEMVSGRYRAPSWHEWAYATVYILALAGHHEPARELLLRLHEASVVWPYDGLILNASHDWIRSDPGLEPFVSRSREAFEEMLASLDAARERGELPSYLEGPLAEVRAELGYD